MQKSRIFLAAAFALLFTAVLWAVDGPLTPLMNLRGRTDENGYLRISAGTAGLTDGPLTPLSNLRGRTDGNGYLRVALTNVDSQITAGTAAGITVNQAGALATNVYKVTLEPAAFVCAAVTCDVTIATLPANTWLDNVTASIATQFACTATCTSSTLSFILGKGAGGSEYLASLDADAAAAIFGDADAEMGTLLTRAAAIQGGTFNGTSQVVVLRLTSGTGNIGNATVTNLSGGSIVIWLTTTRLP